MCRVSMEPVALLTASTIDRYGRQLLVPAFGPQAHLTLASLTVLIIGAGGLGCPSALYLASSGIKHIGIVDDDSVDEGNLHRQIAHNEARVGLNKARSLAITLRSLNSKLQVTLHEARFSAINAEALVSAYDIILDCTDNPGTRYLINDASILHGKPLVSGAAIGCDGQMSVYGWQGGPCYRCIHPVPPPHSMVSNCADAGVLGPITGVIGSLQALEVMKIAASLARARLTSEVGHHGAEVHSQHVPTMGEPLAGSMLVFDGSEGRMRTVRLRGKRPDCAVCGSCPSITSVHASHAWIVAQGLAGSDQEGQDEETRACQCDQEVVTDVPDLVPHISVRELQESLMRVMDKVGQGSHEGGGTTHASQQPLLDVREPVQYSIAALRPSVNVPLAVLQRTAAVNASGGSESNAHSGSQVAAEVRQRTQLEDLLRQEMGLGPEHPLPVPVHVICRRGVDSVTAARLLNTVGIAAVNVSGGLRAWSKEVDSSLPWY